MMGRERNMGVRSTRVSNINVQEESVSRDPDASDLEFRISDLKCFNPICCEYGKLW